MKRTKRQMANNFRKAARLIEKYGRSKGSMNATDGSFCAAGALAKAIHPKADRDTINSIGYDMVPEKTFANKHTPKYSDGTKRSLASFNDSLAKNDSGKKTIVKFLRKCAYLLDHGAEL